MFRWDGGGIRTTTVKKKIWNKSNKTQFKIFGWKSKKISTIIRCCSMIKEECKVLINERKECNEK